MTYFSFAMKKHPDLLVLAPQTDQFKGVAILHETYWSDNQITQ